VYSYFGQYQEAAQVLERAVRLAPEGADAYNNLGVAYYHLGRYEVAAEALNRAARLAPEFAPTYRNLSDAYQKLGRFKEADEARQVADRLAAAAPAQRGPRLLASGDLRRDAQGPADDARRAGSSILIIKDDVRADEQGGEPAARDTARAPLAPEHAAVKDKPQEQAAGPAATQPTPVTAPDTEAGPAAAVNEAHGHRAIGEKVAAPQPEPALDNEAAPDPLTKTYRVGVGDVLDIRLLNATTQGPTLYTIQAGGLLDYPLAGEPVQVVGLTPGEIEAQLAARIKLYEQPRVVAGVHEYTSHVVNVSGLVSTPGAKVLRREAVPLYVLLADAQPKDEAGRALIMSPAGQRRVVELDDAEAVEALVRPGDVVTVLARPPQFFYVGGEVKQPGEKAFRPGITLTQAILIAGGQTRTASDMIEVIREGANRLLTTTRYDLRRITSGQIPDLLIQAGDRIEVKH
jgi:protein involved in polysaccharide export with SLBB domain/Flp pilus assembly protein TadD